MGEAPRYRAAQHRDGGPSSYPFHPSCRQRLRGCPWHSCPHFTHRCCCRLCGGPWHSRLHRTSTTHSDPPYPYLPPTINGRLAWGRKPTHQGYGQGGLPRSRGPTSRNRHTTRRGHHSEVRGLGRVRGNWMSGGNVGGEGGSVGFGRLVAGPYHSPCHDHLDLAGCRRQPVPAPGPATPSISSLRLGCMSIPPPLKEASRQREGSLMQRQSPAPWVSTLRPSSISSGKITPKILLGEKGLPWVPSPHKVLQTPVAACCMRLGGHEIRGQWGWGTMRLGESGQD